jgi:hypothetical protein
MPQLTIWTSLKKLSGAAMALVTLLLLCSAGYFYVTSELNNDKIPEGIYKLTNARPYNSSVCNLSNGHFGSIIIVDGRNAVTNLSPNISYDINNNGEQTYRIGPALTDCEYKNGQLIFNCQDTFIIYQIQNNKN